MESHVPDSFCGAVIEQLRGLTPGRHYGASTDSGCWVMVGRNLVDVTDWSIVPSDASLTLCWGAGGCAIEFGGGSLKLSSGDCMWIDAGLAHRGENLPGSDFLTVFIPDRHIATAVSHIGPVGAAARHAPPDIASVLAGFAGLLLAGGATQDFEAPFLTAVLDWVRATFEPRHDVGDVAQAVLLAASLLRDSEGSAISIASVATTVGLSSSELSRRFKAYYRLTPESYRKQVRLARATRALAQGSSVMEAAHEAGFSDTAHLSRTFRDQYGIAPSRWAHRFAVPALTAAR